MSDNIKNERRRERERLLLDAALTSLRGRHMVTTLPCIAKESGGIKICIKPGLVDVIGNSDSYNNIQPRGYLAKVSCELQLLCWAVGLT